MSDRIRVDALNATVTPQRNHEFPAMRDGITVKLRLEQVLSLLQSSDIPSGAVDLSKLAADARDSANHTYDPTASGLTATDVQAAIDEVAAGTGSSDQVARDMAASALAYAMATNDAASITGAVGAFRLSDDFRTDSLATKTGARYSAANGWYSSEGGGGNVLPAMTAATTSGVTITDSTGRGSPFQAWRGADQNDGTSFMSAATGGAFTWTIDLGSGNSETATGYAITEIHAAEWAGGARTPPAWTFEGSNDGSSWTTLDTRSGIAAVAANNRVVYTFSNAVGYRYYRMNVPGKSGNVQGWAEFELLETGDMTLRPTAATITANPSDVLGHFAYVPVDAVTLGTDLVVRYSIDNGVTWAIADLASLGALGSTGEIIARASADVDAQSGSSLVYSIETANLKQIRVTRFVGAVPLY